MIKLSSIDFLNSFHQFKRRLNWFVSGMTFRKASNFFATGMQYALKSERLFSWPVIVKIDVSPLCNLQCTICVHAREEGNPVLEKQHFDKTMKMSFERYREIIDQVKGKSFAVSPYNLGDPLMHPDIEKMCAYARDAGLNVHISTNFSFQLSDERIRSLARCGITHFTVCIDGMTQDTFSMTRVGGRIDLVKSNLERLCAYKKQHRLRYPIVEAQFLKFPHNLHQLPDAREWLEKIGVDKMVDFYGTLHNYTVDVPGNFTVSGPKKKAHLPLCYWPYFFLVINYNGDVIPCCWYRMYAHNSSDPKDRSTVFGNIFESSLKEIWNSEPYRIARRLVSRPELAVGNPLYRKHYCYHCPQIFETDWRKNHRIAPEWTFDDVYEMIDGRPVRRPDEQAALLRERRMNENRDVSAVTGDRGNPQVPF